MSHWVTPNPLARYFEQIDCKDPLACPCFLYQETGDSLDRVARFEGRLIMAGFVDSIFLATEYRVYRQPPPSKAAVWRMTATALGPDIGAASAGCAR